MSRAVVHGAIGLLAALAAACGGNQTEQAGPAVGDTIRGIVVITGADPLSTVSLRAGETYVPLRGESADSLRAANGLEVWITGEHQDDGFRVEAFRVRGMDRLQAIDGRLEIEGDTAVLVTPAGDRLRFPRAPGALRELAGRRVWIAGEPGREPQAWGVIGVRR